MHRVFGRRLSGAHHAVNCYPGGKFIDGFIAAQSLRYVGALIELVGIDARQILHAAGAQLFEQCLAQFLVGLGNDFTGVGLNNAAGNHAANQKIFGNTDMGRARLLELSGMAGGDTLVFGHHHFAAFVGDVKAGHFSAQAFGDKFHLRPAVHQAEIVVDKEVGKNRLMVQTDGL